MPWMASVGAAAPPRTTTGTGTSTSTSRTRTSTPSTPLQERRPRHLHRRGLHGRVAEANKGGGSMDAVWATSTTTVTWTLRRQVGPNVLYRAKGTAPSRMSRKGRSGDGERQRAVWLDYNDDGFLDSRGQLLPERRPLERRGLPADARGLRDRRDAGERALPNNGDGTFAEVGRSWAWTHGWALDVGARLRQRRNQDLAWPTTSGRTALPGSMPTHLHQRHRRGTRVDTRKA